MTDRERIKELEEHFKAYVELVATAEQLRDEAMQECEKLRNNLAATQCELDGADKVIANLRVDVAENANGWKDVRECLDWQSERLASALKERDFYLSLARAMEAERDKKREERDIAVENHSNAISRAESSEQRAGKNWEMYQEALGEIRRLKDDCDTLAADLRTPCMKVQVEQLKPGQEVALANCVQTATVVRREGKNLYTVNWKGREIQMTRTHIAVSHKGQWKFGPYNAQ